ncbi:S-layer family protein [Nodularia harveyana UHCC-0300]|uniref:S-layer family protein n=1 Tax=Nodularia harveyana UHCC-0300 TaxID=2974287 RepID=A0ABU5UAP7_9CYAN|nr:S-layer family protein [Nodularia harveyana]MEA5580041.1 S-layer family protein [Nodularia harveyana UHCC-0300]
MNLTSVCLGLISGILAGGIIFPANAQVASDGKTNTIVNPNGNNFNILNGIEQGNNLFHSFSNFSLPTGNSATFDLINAPNITTIFSRVTGGNISNIDGLIQTLNSSNPVSLFLMNPNGIVFGENASLNIGGSFVGTTANSIKFADGTEFSAVNPVEPPLLTMSAPVGLQMGTTNAGAIAVQNSGHRITSRFFAPADRSQNPIGLQVGAGNTLALIGSGVNFFGGVASTDGGGHLEVGSVSDGLVKLNSTTAGLVGDYSTVNNFNDIHLAQQSLLDASGSGGSIQLQGRNISFTEGSAGLLHNFGIQQPSHGITIKATEDISLTGNTSDGKLESLIQIDNLGITPSGDINLSARLLLKDGASIRNWTFTPVNGGNITANVMNMIDIDGFALANPIVSTSISSVTLNSGTAGDINLSAGNMRIMNSGTIITTSQSSGQAGILRFDLADLLEIAGNNPFTAFPSSISSSTSNTGDSGSTFINTSRLLIRDSGILGSSTVASGAAGNVRINASESVEVKGRAFNSILPARIASSAEILDPITQAALRLPAIPTGKAGSLTINTPILSITDGAFVTVKNDGPNSAGDLQINANSIFLNNQGSISASTASGNGGNVKLNLQNYLLMRRDSQISAMARGQGNGGNLSITSPVIVGLENSDIIANAVQGKGGNIAITTQGIIGLKFRNTLTPREDLTNDITASSEFNLNGTVQINNFGIDPNSGLVELPANLVDASQEVAAGCAETSGSSFVATGRGGIPQNPTQDVRSDRTWSDVRDISAFQHKNSPVTAKISETPAPLVQATSWRHNAQGKIELVADKSIAITPQLLTCAAVTKN